MLDKKICEECADFLIGRSDKRFCSDACRNNFNNKLNTDNTAAIKQINVLLKRNRKILQQLAPDGKGKIKKSKMQELNFSFKYFTHLQKTQKGAIYYFCYDFGYLALEDDFILIVKNEG